MFSRENKLFFVLYCNYFVTNYLLRRSGEQSPVLSVSNAGSTIEILHNVREVGLQRSGLPYEFPFVLHHRSVGLSEIFYGIYEATSTDSISSLQ